MSPDLLNHYIAYFNKQEGRKYPCSNQTVLCGLITREKEKAIEYMKNKDVVQKRERADVVEWTLSNGERWRWFKWWNDNCRGYRFYKVAVDTSIDDETFMHMILHCCTTYCCSMETI